MKLLSKGRASLAALVAGGVLALFAPPARASKAEADLPGAMTIHDEAAIFSAEGKRSAQDKMGAAKFNRGLHFTVDTHKSAPADIQAKLKGGDKDKVMRDWAKSLATGDRAKGPYVLICMSPGYTEVVLDEETLNRGFTQANAGELQRIFNSALIEAGKKPAAERNGIRDTALLRATDYVINDLRGTKVVHTDGTPVGSASTTKAGEPAKKAGMGIGGWICLGLVVLLAIWLVVGIIRALTSPAYGGGGGYGGGPGYGGGGGGGFGFGTALLGGMFGAMAGMYLYNTMMGTHYPPQAFGGEATAGDTGGDTGDTGAGDYDGGASAGGGGDYGDGGGDYGGGGGDYGGGGGDYGGGDYGGGDYGGGGDFGGGDYGGGGDF